MRNNMNVAELIPEDDLDAVAELLNYPIRQHKEIVEEQTDEELEIRTFSGSTLQKLFTRLGFEKGMEKLAELMRDEIDKGHDEIRELLEEQEDVGDE
ncbi:MAG: hypothetical protein ABEJ71_02655 [Halodesulfurarchaeum sp.]